jgi:hypothetical protein
MCSSSSLDLYRISTLTGEILPEINYTRFYDPLESNSGIKARLWKIKRIKKILQFLSLSLENSEKIFILGEIDRPKLISRSLVRISHRNP